ncbi:MAG: hypothetical protein HQK96_03010 [Nitrospirae bacterium]|nr:hypothetical protein [Nitrospirota bacterium]
MNVFASYMDVTRFYLNILCQVQSGLYKGSTFYKALLSLDVLPYALPVFLFYPFTVIMGIAISSTPRYSSCNDKKLYYILLLLFILILLVMTPNINMIVSKVYELFFLYVPFARMYRTITGKFGYVFVFIYALNIAFSINYIYNKISNLNKNIFNMIFAILFIFSAYTVYTGKIFTQYPVWPTDSLKLPNEFTDEYLGALSRIGDMRYDGKYSTFPFSTTSYSIIKGTMSGVYFGPSPILCLCGKADFNAFDSLGIYEDVVYNAMQNGDKESVSHILNLYNIRYIIDTFDSDTYKQITGFLWKFQRTFHDHASIQYYIKSLGFRKIAGYNDFGIYASTDSLPRFYIPNRISLSYGSL